MKYPPFSWLRLGEEIKHSPGRIWFAFDKLPLELGNCTANVYIGSADKFYNDPYDALTNNDILLPRQQKVLEIFLKLAKPAKSKNEFILDYQGFSKLLPYCSALPIEILGMGVLSFAKVNARIKATLKDPDTKDATIHFSLSKAGLETIENPHFYGDVNAYIIDNDAKVYPIVPPMTSKEAQAILSSQGLPLLGLCQSDSRQMFYSLARLGIDFSCLHKIAKDPDQCQMALRILLDIDAQNGKMLARAHLITEIGKDDFSDEVEVRAIGSIPSVHICADKNMDEERYLENVSIPTLLRRPYKNEDDARNFLFHLGASPARLHDGFELKGENAFSLLKSITEKGGLPNYLTLDEHTRPELIYLEEKPKLIISAAQKKPTRVDVAISLSEEFDNTGTSFLELSKAKDHLLVVDQDTLVVANDKILSTLSYLAKTLNIEQPKQLKSKSVAQIALIINALKEHVIIEADEDLKIFLDNFSITKDKEDRYLPKDLTTSLRPYQHDAVAWLSSLYRSGLGGLLGDEMGLGKTIMVLTHLAKLKEKNKKQNPALVVCPTSVMDVWKEEARIHLPNLRVIKWHGSDRHSLKEILAEYDIVVTSYAILRRDIDGPLSEVSFSTLVLDEAQYVRNQLTDSFRAAKKVKCLHRIALTGTPIENHVGDLFNILDCVEEGILGSKKNFDQQFTSAIESGFMSNAINLKMLIAPIVTRRKKSEVESELPPKIESVVHCKLTAEQRNLYKLYVNQMSGTILKDTGPAKKGSDRETHFSLLSALTRLRQICCHPSLIVGKEAGPQSSGKIIALREIISECLEMGRKIIIYSQFLKMQEHIVELAKELDPKGALWLHGSTINRDEVVRGFQSEDGPRIIVVSLKAGGTGITLTAADTVIFADPWWNPAVEEQAIDRAHRIGQKKTVHVIRLIAEDSIEGEVVALAQRKKLAATTILQEGFKTASNLSKDEVHSLLLKELHRVKEAESTLDFHMDSEE